MVTCKGLWIPAMSVLSFPSARRSINSSADLAKILAEGDRAYCVHNTRATRGTKAVGVRPCCWTRIKTNCDDRIIVLPGRVIAVNTVSVFPRLCRRNATRALVWNGFGINETFVQGNSKSLLRDSDLNSRDLNSWYSRLKNILNLILEP